MSKANTDRRGFVELPGPRLEATPNELFPPLLTWTTSPPTFEHYLQSHRKSLSIGEYALSQTSLEQVFNGFAAQQEEELGQAAGMAQ